jgi:hypothetical protein
MFQGLHTDSPKHTVMTTPEPLQGPLRPGYSKPRATGPSTEAEYLERVTAARRLAFRATVVWVVGYLIWKLFS